MRWWPFRRGGRSVNERAVAERIAAERRLEMTRRKWPAVERAADVWADALHRAWTGESGERKA